MVRRNYIPERADIVWLSLDPVLGHEEAGRRPALVLSPREYNRKTSMAVCCPITKSVKGYAFEVEVMIDKLKCAVLVDQIKALDWSKRKCEYISLCQNSVFLEVQRKIIELIKG